MTKRLTAEERLTPAMLEAIRKRAENATEGPWHRTYKYSINIEAESKVIIDDSDGVVRYSDAEFIAEARTDIPALLAEIERLREALGFISRQYDYTSVNTAKDVAIKALNGGGA